jgi:hypothetical protein
VTDSLVSWLRVQLDLDAQTAKTATPGPWFVQRRTWGGWSGGRTWPGVWINNDAADPESGWVVAYDGGPPASMVGGEDAAHIALWDPARVLADIDSKRQLVTSFESVKSDPWTYDEMAEDVAERALKMLALPYAERPGFQESWRP